MPADRRIFDQPGAAPRAVFRVSIASREPTAHVFVSEALMMASETRPDTAGAATATGA